MKIVIASNNKGKLNQFKDLFKNENIEFLSLEDIGYTKDIIENADTFEGNSYLKANQVCLDTGYITVADDSGLCVDALNGEPGVYSARYAGKNKTREQQLNFLLDKMANIDHPNRTAKFVAVITCCFPNGSKIVTTGELNGKISKEIVNIENGLTFDPVFIPNGYNTTMSMLSDQVKVEINHRGQAARKFLEEFKKYI